MEGLEREREIEKERGGGGERKIKDRHYQNLIFYRKSSFILQNIHLL